MVRKMTTVIKTIKYEDYKASKRFQLEPSRRGTSKRTDPEQIEIFMKRQKHLVKFWRNIGIVSWKTLDFPDNNPDDK